MQAKPAKGVLILLVCALGFSFAAVARQNRRVSVIPSPSSVIPSEARNLLLDPAEQDPSSRTASGLGMTENGAAPLEPARPAPTPSAVIPSPRQRTGNEESRSASPPAQIGATPTAPSSNAIESRTRVIVPHLIKFGGVMTDLAGKPMSGPMDLTFALYKDQAGGEPLWFETQRVELDSQGHYTVLLGAMYEGGVPINLSMSGEAQWLGVAAGKGHAIADGWDTYSSLRYKEDVRTIHGTMRKVEKLRGVTYKDRNSDKPEVGVIAEEVAQVLPQMVEYDKEGQAQGVDYGRLTALLIQAVKEQQKEIRRLRNQVKSLNARLP